ncbi:hypothetical protein [Petrocella sp. FN5]|uniref:hypothetical protein n=1 Tax=Petrocella sp. FN5 TaxID=3032002 RepID=UPI0023DA2602|nr:hypothetical protein [Petrocella sp. FN5]MDF1618012.1 hypothetical protein [Petrocella sp. FN5]
MNLIKFAILFTIITLPFYMIHNFNTHRLAQRERLKNQYERIINSAIEDGTYVLKTYSKKSYDESRRKYISIETEEVIEAFLKTYHYGFKAFSDTAKHQFNQYIVAIVIIGYDGYYLYGTKQVTDVSGVVSHMPVLSEKKPYIYEDLDFTMKMTLDDFVEIVDMKTWEVEKGNFASIVHKPSGINEVNFEQIRKRTIVTSVEEGLRDAVIGHNQWAKQQGMLYEFIVPIADNDPWSRSLDDIGLMACIQGAPLGYGAFLDFFSFHQSNVLKIQAINGYEDMVDGSFYYCDHRCTHEQRDNLIQVFATKEAAASEGFWPCHYLNK